MNDRTDWGSVLTKAGDPLTVKVSKFLVDTPDPAKSATPSNTTTPPSQGSTAPWKNY